MPQKMYSHERMFFWHSNIPIWNRPLIPYGTRIFTTHTICDTVSDTAGSLASWLVSVSVSVSVPVPVPVSVSQTPSALLIAPGSLASWLCITVSTLRRTT